MFHVSHEVPLSLLDRSRSFNDYDYCLVHLLDKEPQYKAFYMKSVELGRKVLLDNSIFELGVAFEADKFAEKIAELNPFEYIVPDCLENTNQTIANFESWLKKYKGLPGKKIGVIQGKTKEELFDCYLYMSEHADKIAVSFDYSYYLVTERDRRKYCREGNESNKFLRYAAGRQHLLTDLIQEMFINMEKPHHLLGCASPNEFEFYAKHNYKFIETIDTSSPVVHAIKGVKYPEYFDNWKKESIKLVDLLHTPIEDIPQDLLKYNLERFKNFVGR